MDLRSEIVESEKLRSDLFKWKIILVAALGAAGLGFGDAGKAMSQPEFLFCLIPLVCVYVDILSSHLNLRIMVIGHYLLLVRRLRDRGIDAKTDDAEYENFAESARAMPLTKAKEKEQRLNAFALEDIAQHYSSGLLSLFVLLWGVARLRSGMILTATGLLGFLASLIAYSAYKKRLAALGSLVEKKLEESLPQNRRPSV